MSRNKYPEETVNLILDVSQRLFIEKGYNNTTIQDIIDELGGLTKGAIYHHFSSKQDILDAVIERLFAKNTLSASWRKIQSDTGITGGEKLKRMLAAALTDEQEQQFRKLGVHLQNMPQMLSDLVLRSVNDIAPNAFENCRRLEKVEFPKSLKSIENEAFINCLSLKEADYGKNVTVAPDAFKGCINL